MITYYFRAVKDKELQSIDKPRAGVWAHAVAPTEEELKTLKSEFSLDESILADAQDFFEMPRFERAGGAMYFFIRYPFEDTDEDIDTAPMLIVMGESYVLTITQRDVRFLKSLTDGKREIHTTQKTKLFLQIMSSLTSEYEKELVRMRRAVHRDKVRLRNIRMRDIERLVKYESTLNDIVSALVPTNAWLQQVLSGNYLQLFNEDVELVEDLMIANNQLVDSAKSVLKTIQNVRSAYEAILTNTLNSTIKMLTAFTILLTIPMIIASLYGMNVPLPLGNHPSAFWLVMVLIVTLVSLAGYFFGKSGWLK